MFIIFVYLCSVVFKIAPLIMRYYELPCLSFGAFCFSSLLFVLYNSICVNVFYLFNCIVCVSFFLFKNSLFGIVVVVFLFMCVLY